MTKFGFAEIFNLAEFDRNAIERRSKRMGRIDDMTPEMRQLVHEYGLTVIDSFVQIGIKKPGTIRHLVETVLSGSQDSGRRLLEAKLEINAMRRQIGRLHTHNVSIVPKDPTDEMVEASINALAAEGITFDTPITRARKHKIRLKHALEAGLKQVQDALAADVMKDRGGAEDVE